MKMFFLIFSFIPILFFGNCTKNSDANEPEQPEEYTVDLDVYPTENIHEQMPVLIFIHGGAWLGGDKSEWTQMQADLFKSQKYVSVSINYRLASETGTNRIKHPMQIQDISKALRWVQDSIAKYGGNPHQLVLTGHSAGAHLAALLCTNQQYVQKAGFAISNIKLVCLLDAGSYLTLENGQPNPSYAAAYTRVAGRQEEGLWLDFTPAEHLSRNKYVPPFYLISSDNAYRIKANEWFAQKLKANGIQCRHDVVPSLTHPEMLFYFPNYRGVLTPNAISTINTFLNRKR